MAAVTKTLDALTADAGAEVRRQEALLKTGALQNAILNSANFSSIATDDRGVIQLFNVGAERMLGYAAADVLNKITPADISDPQELIARADTLSVELGTTISPGFDALVFKASRGIEDIYELTYIRKDGSRFWASGVMMSMRDATGTAIGFVKILRDQTEERQAREELEAGRATLVQAAQDKERAMAALEAADVAKDRFLAVLAHELRNPLASIGAAAAVLSNVEAPPADLAQAAAMVRRQVDSMRVLLNDLLDVSMLRLDKLVLQMRRIELASVVQSAVEATTDATVRITNLSVVENSQGAPVVMSRNCEIVLTDGQNRERARFRVPYGSRILVAEGAQVQRGQKLAEWDPFTLPIITERAGFVEYADLIEGITLVERQDEVTGLSSKVVVDSHHCKTAPTSLKEANNCICTSVHSYIRKCR